MDQEQSRPQSPSGDADEESRAAGPPSTTRDIVVVAAVALLALMLGVNLFVWIDDGESTGGVEGQSLPSITFEVAGTTEAIELASFEGQPLVIDFWAEWCTACKSQMPRLEALAADDDLGGQVQFLSVNVDVDDEERPQKVAPFLEGRPAAMTTVLDSGPAQQWFEVVRLPTLVFIDAQGTVVEVSEGVHSEEELRAKIEALDS